MSLFDLFHILFVLNLRLFGVRNEECVVSVSSRMSLRLEQCIEIPERAFNISIGFHLLESHLSQNLFKLLPSFHENVQIAVLNFSSFGVRVEVFELTLLP